MNKLLFIFWSRCMRLHYALLTGNATSYVGAAFLLLLNLSVSFAQPTLVKDINVEKRSSLTNIKDLVSINNLLYFSASNSTFGNELWKSDGTTAGTEIVKDIMPGAASATITNVTVVNKLLFFTTSDNISYPQSFELWKSDGTTAGTMLVKDIFPGTATSAPANLINVNGTLFFTADNGSNGRELWKSDGTTAGTVMVKDIASGASGANLANLVNANGILYFTVGGQIWKSNGTTAGTILVKEVNGNPGRLTYAKGTVFFTAYQEYECIFGYDDPDGFTCFTYRGKYQLWKTDGTATGTVKVKDMQMGSYDIEAAGLYPIILAGTADALFLTCPNSLYDYTLWKSDGTTEGTIALKFFDGSGTGSDGNPYFTPVGNTLYFSDYTLWKSDGTKEGTVMVKALDAGGPSQPYNLTNVNGTLYFGSKEGYNSNQFWKSDGSAAGTTLVKNVGPSYENIESLTYANGKLFFSAGYGRDLWNSDGTTDGTTLMMDANAISKDASPNFLSSINGSLFFSADNGTQGNELWKTDGTSSGTVLVKDIFSGANGSFPHNSVTINNTLFFNANDGVKGQELWKSDGTAAGTMLVKDISPGIGGSNPSFLTNVNGTLFFVAYSDTFSDLELWKSDGTAAGTVLVKDIAPGSEGSLARSLTNVNGTLFFVAWDGTGYDLWKSNGTAVGTVKVKDIFNNYDYWNSIPSNLTNVNGTLFFTANDGNGYELWKSDGTAAGTVMVKDIEPTGGSNPSELTNVNGTLYFAAQKDYDYELWKSNGTTAGTVRVKDIVPGTTSSFPENLTNVNGILYFSANVGGNFYKRQLWKSDGTTAGTVSISDVFVDITSGSDAMKSFLNVNGTLFFVGETAENGHELWKSNGTKESTVLISDIAPGSASSLGPRTNLVNVNNSIYFVANNGKTGGELWKFDPGSCTSSIQTNLTITGSTVCSGINGNITIKASQAGVSYQASINGSPVGNAITGGGDITLTIPAVSLSAGNNIYTIQASGCTIATLTNTATIVVNNCPPSNCTATGTILQEYWSNVSGTLVSAIPVTTTPTSTSQLTSFETPSNLGDNYGQRVRGYVCAPATGSYTFYIASDDNSELWLSTDDNPTNKKRIAYISGNGSWAVPRDWTKFTSQKSAGISLVAGKKYYIEALQKEGVGGDNLAVGWILPNTSSIVVIAGTYLSPFSGTTPANQAPTVYITSPVSNAVFTAPASITLTATAADSDGSVSKVEFYHGATKLAEDLTSTYSYGWNNVVAGTYTLTAKAIDNQGAVTTSSPVTVTVNESTPGGNTSFYRAINLNGSAVSIDNHLYEASSSAANFSFSGRTFANQNIALVPATDANRTSMIRSSVYSLSSSQASINISGVPTGEYEVYVYVWEDNNAETYNLSLEGSVVEANYNSGSAGKWAKLGPYRKSITDGVINLVASGGAANLSGIEIWKVNTTPAATPVSIPFRINSGGPTVNAEGVTFNADQYYSSNSSTSVYQKPINNTTRDIMYVDYREAASDGGSFSYNIPVSNGTYTINLNFAEVFHSAAGKRVFSVNLEGGAVELANFDVYASAGANTAITKVYTVTVTDGMLNIDFTSSMGKAMINALQVQAAANARIAVEEALPPTVTLLAYPNPFAEQLILAVAGVEGKVSITLTDVVGKQHYQASQAIAAGEQQLKLDLPNLKAGVYLLKLQTTDGESKVIRVIKK